MRQFFFDFFELLSLNINKIKCKENKNKIIRKLQIVKIHDNIYFKKLEDILLAHFLIKDYHKDFYYYTSYFQKNINHTIQSIIKEPFLIIFMYNIHWTNNHWGELYKKEWFNFKEVINILYNGIIYKNKELIEDIVTTYKGLNVRVINHIDVNYHTKIFTLTCYIQEQKIKDCLNVY